MYNGYTESDEKIAARKARILKDYKPVPQNQSEKMPSGSLEEDDGKVNQ